MEEYWTLSLFWWPKGSTPFLTSHQKAWKAFSFSIFSILFDCFDCLLWFRIRQNQPTHPPPVKTSSIPSYCSEDMTSRSSLGQPWCNTMAATNDCFHFGFLFWLPDVWEAGSSFLSIHHFSTKYLLSLVPSGLCQTKLVLSLLWTPDPSHV